MECTILLVYAQVITQENFAKVRAKRISYVDYHRYHCYHRPCNIELCHVSLYTEQTHGSLQFIII